MFAKRYAALATAVAATFGVAAAAQTGLMDWPWVLAPMALTGLGIRDLLQTRHSILRNYPIIGHCRFFFELIRPEIRQYLIESDQGEQAFRRAQRSLGYQPAKNPGGSRPLGTELNVRAPGHEWINYSLA